MEDKKLKILALLFMIGVVASSLALVPRIMAADLADNIFHIGRYSGDIVSDCLFPLHV